MVRPARALGWFLCLVIALVHFGLSALLGGGNWYLLGFSYVFLWPWAFACTILPGVLIGAHVQTWQASIALTEIATIVVAIVFFGPTPGGLFQSLFGQQLIMTHLALFPPLLLSVLIGHFGRSR
jgi:hypothetical protein